MKIEPRFIEDDDVPRKGRKNTVNKKNRIVYLFEDINEESSMETVRDLVELDQDKKKRPIKIYICSPGGDCGYGFAIIDILLHMKCNTIGIAVGEICSMAPAIFVACKERYISEHSFVMLHPVTVGTGDYVKFAKARVLNAEVVENMYDEFFLKRTTIPKKFYIQAKDKELWLNAEEAIKYGIAKKLL
jgi:ATP-dependent Clp protease protease subunit